MASAVIQLDHASSLRLATAVPIYSSQAPPRLVHLQILRAFAASLVAADHSFGALSGLGVRSDPYHQPGFLCGYLGVTAFFVLSGFIMVRQSADLFAAPSGPWIFAGRRIIRIVPMYWLSTLLCFALPFHRKLVQPKLELLLSFGFIPDFIYGVKKLEPVLPAGWTLNYEMAFYLLFFAALFLPRRFGFALLISLPALLFFNAHSHPFPAHSPLGLMFGFYTDKIILTFAAGVLLGLLDLKAASLPRFNSKVSPALLLLIPPILWLAFPTSLGAAQAWDATAIYSLFVVFVCTRANNGLPGPIQRTLILLGDASYSSYLFHILTYPLVVPLAIRLWGHHARSTIFLLLVMMTCVIVSNLIGLLVHKAIETPLIRALKKLPRTLPGAIKPATA